MMQRRRKRLKDANRHALRTARAHGLTLPPGFEAGLLALMDGPDGEQLWAEALHRYRQGERVTMSRATGTIH